MRSSWICRLTWGKKTNDYQSIIQSGYWIYVFSILLYTFFGWRGIAHNPFRVLRFAMLHSPLDMMNPINDIHNLICLLIKMFDRVNLILISYSTIKEAINNECVLRSATLFVLGIGGDAGAGVRTGLTIAHTSDTKQSDIIRRSRIASHIFISISIFILSSFQSRLWNNNPILPTYLPPSYILFSLYSQPIKHLPLYFHRFIYTHMYAYVFTDNGCIMYANYK